MYPVSEGKHSRLRLRQGGETLYAVLFGVGPEKLAYQTGDMVDVFLSVSVYAAGKGPQVSARIVEIRPAGMDNAHVSQSALFESFLAGMEPDETQREQLAPSREDTAAVYRLVRNGTRVNFSDLRPTFACLPEVPTGRVLTALTALEELGLIERDIAAGRYRMVPVQEKTSLENSLLLQRLEQRA